MEGTFNRTFATTDKGYPTDEFTGYSIDVSPEGQVVKAQIADYSKEKGGYHTYNTKRAGEEGFEETLQKCLHYLCADNNELINFIRDFPELYAQLKEKYNL